MKKVLVYVCFLLLICSGWCQGQSYGLGYQTSVAGALAMIATELDFFTAEGLAIQPKVFTDGTLVVEALAANAIQFGVCGDVPTLTALAAGLPVQAVAELGGGGRRQRLMVTDQRITSLKDLKGQKVGLTRGTSGFNAFHILCSQQGLNLTDFQIINIRPVDMPEALASRQVQAVLTWEPTPTLIEDAGIGFEILNLADAEVKFPMILLARNSVIKADPAAVQKVIRALNRAAAYLEADPTGAAGIVAKVTGLSVKQAQRSLSYHYYRVGWSQEVEASLQLTAQLFYAEKLLRGIPQWEKVFQPAFCKELGLVEED